MYNIRIYLNTYITVIANRQYRNDKKKKKVMLDDGGNIMTLMSVYIRNKIKMITVNTMDCKKKRDVKQVSIFFVSDRFCRG